MNSLQLDISVRFPRVGQASDLTQDGCRSHQMFDKIFSQVVRVYTRTVFVEEHGRVECEKKQLVVDLGHWVYRFRFR